MTIYLRNEKNQSLLDLEVWKKGETTEVSAGVPIKAYSMLLLSRPSQTDYIIDAFDELDQLRGWYWERFVERNPNHTMKELLDAIYEILTPICKELDLHIVTD